MPKSTLVRSERQGEGEDASIEGHAGDGQKVLGQQREQSAQRSEADADAGGAAEAGEQKVLEPELLLNLPAARAEGQAGGDFRKAARHANERESGEIGAGDEQDESRSEHEGDGARTELGGHSALQRHGVIGDFGAGIFAFDLGDAIGPGAIDFGIGLLPGCASL